MDIDLTWLPMQDFDTDTIEITEALTRIARRLSAPPLRLQVRTTAGEGARTISRLIASRGRTQVQIETTPVMRGTVHPVRRMNLRPSVERQFGSAQIQVLSFADLYAGKMAAALSRQHPRDWFDIGVLLDHNGIDPTLWRTFLIYLIASPKPADMLAPSEPRDFAAVFESQFSGMTREPVTVEWLLDARARLLARIADLMDDPRATSCSRWNGRPRHSICLNCRTHLTCRVYSASFRTCADGRKQSAQQTTEILSRHLKGLPLTKHAERSATSARRHLLQLLHRVGSEGRQLARYFRREAPLPT